MRIAKMVRKAHANAVAKGWWDDEPEFGQPGFANMVGAKLALVHAEVSEALECLRNDDSMIALLEWRSAEGVKPEGIASELADVVIRIGDLCGRLGIDLGGAIAQKMAYNKTRPQRHGGKTL